ncbi:hypothetical protein GcM3_038038 [Golovinomyces cichoracearum]|uniref:Uncharacterized protein n=1 Tax=Golovinomyces cichoracearum TaxID=62708 RepID=A0A420J2X8_9PEZI|nr:hypothetical protein GcM3_038038 [Golovinomyces cichoracearum]
MEEIVELKNVGDSKNLSEYHLNLSQNDKFCFHEQMTEKLPVSRLNSSDIDERHIVFGKRIRKKHEKAMYLDPSALIATSNVFMPGKAKELLKLYQSRLLL